MFIRARTIAIVATTTALFATGVVAAVPSRAAVWGSTTVFNPIGNEQSYTVPAGVSEVYLQAVGAQGGNKNAKLQDGIPVTLYGGDADDAQGYLRVRSGDVLYAEVGSPGGGTGTGGWNGGGSGGVSSRAGAGGGGASDVRLCSIHSPTCFGVPYDSALSRVLVAAGGGGAGNCMPMYVVKECGIGGKAEAAGGTGEVANAGKGGGQGTPTAGGAGGVGGTGLLNGQDGLPGGVAQGGAGGSGDERGNGDGGGGGGGYFAGGGGGQGALHTPRDCEFPSYCIPGPGGGGGGGQSAFGRNIIDGSFRHNLYVAPPGVTITPVALTTTAVTCNSPTLAGAAVTCTATVTGEAGVPTGAVSWSVTTGSGQFTPATCSLQSGQCSVSYRATVGARASQTVQAHYRGDLSSGPSSGTSDIVVNKPSADLAVAQTTRVAPKGAIFGIRVINFGPKTVVNARLDVTLTGSGIRHIRFVSKPAASCKAEPPATGARSAERCVLRSLPAKSAWRVTVGIVGGPAGAQITSAATVAAARPPDSNTANNSVTTVGHYGPATALTTKVVAAPGPGINQAGGIVDVSNLGPSSAAGLTLDIGILAKRARGQSPRLLPSAGSCLRVAAVSPATFSFHCTLSSLAVHDSWRVGLAVPTVASSSVRMTATAGSTGTYDSTPQNSVSTASTTATPVPPIAKAGSWLILGGDNGAALGVYRITAQSPGSLDSRITFRTQPYGTSPTSPTVINGAWILTFGDSGIYRVDTLQEPRIVGSRTERSRLVIKVSSSGDSHQFCPVAALPASGCATPAVTFVVLPPSSISAGQPGEVFVQLQSLLGQPVSGFTGTVALSSTDNAAQLPAPYRFRPPDVGHMFTGASFPQPGLTVVTAGLNQEVNSFPIGVGSVLVKSP